MHKITDVNDVIAKREFIYVSDTGVREAAIVEVGKPFQMNDVSYICPYRLKSNSYERLFGMVGIDSYQALELTMNTIPDELAYWLRKKGGSFENFDESASGFN